MSRPTGRLLALLTILVALLAGCGASRAFSRAEQAARQDRWEEAVEYYRLAVRERPDRPEYRIALERALQQAANWHADRGRQLEAQDRLEEALREYRKASEFDPTNRQIAFRAAEIERTIRERLEAARPRPAIDVLREQARRESPEPVLNPASREPLNLRFTNASLRDVLTFIGNSTGINVTFDRDFQDRPVTIQLDGVTLEEALRQLQLANQFFYKVLGERSLIVAADTPAKRQQYEEQVIRTFYLSHADATEVAVLINSVIRQGLPVPPLIAANKTANTITVRASAPVAAIIERIIEANDKPRAEVVIDVQILEVSRERARNLGVDLSAYSITGIFSPEAPPTRDQAGTPASDPFNLNTITRGVSTADFYLAVPSAVVRLLESDSQTRVIAKPQLRGSEGQRVTLNLGEDVPIPSTTFTPFAGGGANINPLTSFTYRPIGVIVDMTPRVTYDGEIIMDLVVESSARGRDTNIAGQNLPSFGSRKVTTRLRLRDGESNLLAGLLREDERRSLRGLPGILRMPVLRALFASSDSNIQQTDIVMLLTPRIVRTHELTKEDLSPIYVGTQGNMALGGPPPVLAVPEPPQAPPQGQAAAPPALTPQVPPGSSPVPGTTMAPAPPAPPAPSPITVFGPPPEPPAVAPAAPEAPPAGAARVAVAPPAAEMTVGGGPYTVPVTIEGAQGLVTVTVSVTFNPAVLRVRSVQEGTFMRQGGVAATFAQQVDAAAGRVDLVITRAGDPLGATGSGLLAAILFEPVAAGASPLALSGAATAAGGGAPALQFASATVTVR